MWLNVGDEDGVEEGVEEGVVVLEGLNVHDIDGVVEGVHKSRNTLNKTNGPPY